MACDTRLKKNQTISERIEEVRRMITRLASALASGRVKAVVGKQGAIAFEGLTAEERDGVTDACAYRRILATGSVTAKLAIARAEQLAGRTVDRQAVAHGHHSHDGGKTWHSGH